MGRQRGAARAAQVAAVALSLCLAACSGPHVGDRVTGATQVLGPQLVLDDADVDLHGHVRVTFTVSDYGLPLSLSEVRTLDPRFTLATLAPHPVDGLPAWTSLLLTGTVVRHVRPSGPETPDAEVLDSVAQPGSETPASTAIVALGGGRFRYTFATPLPAAVAPGDTLRAGAWLRAASVPSLRTSSTVDFTPSGAAPSAHDLVLDEDCNRCHGNLVLHGTRAGAKLCLTCHTWQNADPDTIDPAAMGTDVTRDPNPLELGRLVHRIHRGKDLPTLYAATSTAPAPVLGTGAPALPYTVFRPGVIRRNPPVPGRKFSVVGYRGAEAVYGWVANHAPVDPALAGTAVAGGVLYPRDLRECAACHGGAPQEAVTTTAVSRRACAGCHPEVWFGRTAITTPVHFAHTGGPQDDDSQCAGCHVAATAAQPKVYAPIADIHVPPYLHPRYDRPVAQIVSVTNLRPGARPTVRFRLFDQIGPISPIHDPSALDTRAAPSPIPRKLTSLTISLAPVDPGRNDYPVASGPEMLSSVTGPAYIADAAGVFTYDFATTLSSTATGIWAVGMEGRRRLDPTPFYDPSSDTLFAWPYTGEAFYPTESFANPVVYVDTAAGSWVEGATTNALNPRRSIAVQEKCERCHGRVLLHGTLRNQLEYCLVCHTPNRTDWSSRRPVSGGNVRLGDTYDGIEERSVHLKVMVHRIHTGARSGAASLEGIEPYVMYGVGNAPYWFDEGRFPNDLRNCTVCHQGQSYRVDAVPASAAPTIANETATIYHSGSRNHAASEPSIPPIQAACLGCHATGATRAHVASHTSGGVEGCATCHAKGTVSVDVAHGLATATGVTASFSSIVQGLLVPSCATSACHSGNPPPYAPRLDADAAYGALVGVASGQAPMKLVEAGAPERSYLLYKLRGDVASAGGSGTPMPPTGALLGAADLAAIEAWISNGAPP